MDYCVTATAAPAGGYTEASVGHCDASEGMHPLTSEEDCSAAAAALGKSDTTMDSGWSAGAYPSGCYYKQSAGELYFNHGGDPSSGDTDRVSLCGDGIVHAGVAAGGSWTELSDKFCETSSHIGTLQSMADATASCLADPSCVYIYDQSCDGTGEFVTCRQSTLTDSTSGSCVYEHGGTGMAVGTMSFAHSSRAVQARISGGGPRGVLELNIDDQGWGAVCDDYFDQAATTTFCLSLGYAVDAVQYDTTHGNSNFAADDIHCDAGATSMEQCATSDEPYTDNCGDGETVGIDCSEVALVCCSTCCHGMCCGCSQECIDTDGHAGGGMQSLPGSDGCASPSLCTNSGGWSNCNLDC